MIQLCGCCFHLTTRLEYFFHFSLRALTTLKGKIYSMSGYKHVLPASSKNTPETSRSRTAMYGTGLSVLELNANVSIAHWPQPWGRSHGTWRAQYLTWLSRHAGNWVLATAGCMPLAPVYHLMLACYYAHICKYKPKHQWTLVREVGMS